MIVDFIFDVASPNTYFAHKLIPDFEKRTGASFRYVPCLLGGIHKLTNNQPPFIAYANCKNTDYAVSRGAFGAPTFFYENQIFFGKDHLYQLEEYINSNK